MANDSKQEERSTKMHEKTQRIISCSVSERDKIIARGLSLSPLDGKRAEVAEKFSLCFSDFAWFKNMVKVEVEWLACYLLTVEDGAKLEAELGLNYCEGDKLCDALELIREDFDARLYVSVKEKQEVLKAPVKAVSQYIKNRLMQACFPKLEPFVQIGCTEEQIETVAYSLMIKEVLEEFWKPAAEELVGQLRKMKTKRTKYALRLRNLLHETMKARPHIGYGFGATVSTDWTLLEWEEYVEKEFAEKYLGLKYNPKAKPLEYIPKLLDGVLNFGLCLDELNRELYLYRGLDIYVANGIFTGVIKGMPDGVDLSPTSLLWNVGEAFAYSMQAIKSTTEGLKEAYK